MGKGFNNYMCKKFFHPASRDNLKRVWMAEQKADSYKKKQDELRVQYEKEQDLYNNKAMLSKESKDKLSVNFMYEPPPGAKKEREREDNEPEYKFEWQRKFNAPREDYCKGDSEIRDQPFGIQVRNVRCIKCHKWGHINTDKECPMYNQSSTSQMLNSSDPLQLIQQMREDGLTIKRSVLEAQQHLHVPVANQKAIVSSSSDEDDDEKGVTQTEKQFLKSLTKKQKLKLLRKLEKLEKRKKLMTKKQKNKKKKDKKKKEKKHKSTKRAATPSSSSSSSDDEDTDETTSEEENNTKRKYKHSEKERSRKNHKKSHSDKYSNERKSSNSDSSEDDRKEKKINKRKHEKNAKEEIKSKKKRK